MECPQEEDSALGLSPWSPNLQQQLLLSKIIAHNSKIQLPAHIPKRRALHLSNNDGTELSFKVGRAHHESKSLHESANWDDINEGSNYLAPHPFIRYRREPNPVRNKTQPVEEVGLDRKFSDMFANCKYRQLFNHTKENERLTKIAQQLNPRLIKIIQRHRPTFQPQRHLVRKETKTFLNKNLVSRQHEKGKAHRNDNIILPKIQICSINHRLL